MKTACYLMFVLLGGLSSFGSSDTPGKAGEKEKLIKAYFGGWVNKDWNAIESILADGFTFTSPAPDDHISMEQFKAKCWVQAQYIESFDFVRIVEGEQDAFAILQCHTTDKAVFRNTEYFTFRGGKIQSIEVFFGTGRGFPTNVER